MTDALTTLLDLADELDDITWEWALESALRRGLVSVEEVIGETARRSRLHRAGAIRARRVLARRPRQGRPTGSQLETEFIQLIRPIPEIPEEERQRPVFRFGRLVARLDVAFPAVKAYTEVHGPQHRESLQYDTTRETTIAATLGWLASEVTARDIRSNPRPTINRMVEFIATAAARTQTSGR
jgi:very-short-patch-repair endonuclease